MKLKSLVWSFFHLFGIDAFHRKVGYHYVPDYHGKSAYKQKNIKHIPVFGETAAKVIADGCTLLYYDRLFTIFQILSLWHDRVQPGSGLNTIEVGVYKGGGSYFIVSVAERLGVPIQHFCFDTFEGHAAEDINKGIETTHVASGFSDTSFDAVKSYLSSFDNVRFFKGRVQDTVNSIPDVPLHFVHLDMDIYEPTIFALRFFEKKLVSGSVILLDDYGFDTCPGVEMAINDFLRSNTDFFGIALLSGQYILVKL